MFLQKWKTASKKLEMDTVDPPAYDSVFSPGKGGGLSAPLSSMRAGRYTEQSAEERLQWCLPGLHSLGEIIKTSGSIKEALL